MEVMLTDYPNDGIAFDQYVTGKTTLFVRNTVSIMCW